MSIWSCKPSKCSPRVKAGDLCQIRGRVGTCIQGLQDTGVSEAHGIRWEMTAQHFPGPEDSCA